MSSPQLPKESLPVRPGDILADKYVVERVLGTGGMGFVVSARIVNLGKLVALKMMLPAAVGMPQAIERFEREARAAVQLKSEHITEVLDIGRLPTGEPYIVMEFLDGSDFEGLLKRDRWLQVEDAVDYVLQACEAVSEAHSLGVVHRDLKPKNLFLSHRLDGTPLVKVLDFGISKWTGSDSGNHSLTSTGDVFGSPNYMSPEQIRSARDVDGRTDIWSLGVILFELLTGRVPFVAESLPQLCALVLETPAPLVSSLRPDLPEGLVVLVARCLEKISDRRFQNVNELVTALEPFGRVRPRLRFSTTSPNASTMMVPASGPPAPTGPPHLMPAPVMPPPDASSAGAHVLSGVMNGTSAAWTETAAADKRGRQRMFVAVLAPVVLLGLGGGVWASTRWQSGGAGLAHAGQQEAGASATSATSATGSSASVTAASATSGIPGTATTSTGTTSTGTTPTNPLNTAAATSSEPVSLAKGRGAAATAATHFIATHDAGAAHAPQIAAPPPASDPFTPGDRK